MKLKNYLIIPALIIWVFLVGWGWIELSRHEYTPGKNIPLSSSWPAVTKLSRSINLPTLVMFMHPRCPCSRASMQQLSQIMTHGQNKVKAQVVFIAAPNFSEDWAKTDLYNSVRRIPGVEVMIDDGTEAKNFQVNVSGQTMLYDTKGQLVFGGGITASRGHQGDNIGQEAIISFLTKGAADQKETPSFGCLLLNKQT